MIESQPISSKDWRSAFEGQRFIAITPTAGTGIIGHAAPTTFDEAKPIFVLFNGNAAKSCVNIYPQQLRLVCSVISTGGTGSKFTFTSDVGNRISTPATALVIANTNTGATVPSQAVISFGAVVGTAATTQRRLLGNYTPRGAVVENVWDEYTFTWGATDGAPSTGINSAASTAYASNFKLPPVAVAPQTSLCIVQWKASQSVGPTFEVQFDYIERQG